MVDFQDSEFADLSNIYLATWRIIPVSKWLLGGGFKYFLFSPLFGEDFQFD